MSKLLRFTLVSPLVWWTVLVIAATSGCALLPGKTAPESQLREDRKHLRRTPEGIIPADLQAEVMDYADRYAARLVPLMDDLTMRLDSPEKRAQAQHFKANQASAAIFIASGPQALDSLLDMAVLVTLGGLSAEETWGQGHKSEQAQSLLETYRQLEEEIWHFAARHLRPAQTLELREMIGSWREQNPDLRAVSSIRFRDIVQTAQNVKGPASQQYQNVIRLSYLDPLAGLNAAARAMEQARLLSRQAMYYAQRLPLVTQWRTELLSFHLALTPELRQTFALSDNLARATEQLPALVGHEREEAIKQVFSELAQAQTNLLAQLAAQEQELGILLTNARAILALSTETAGAADALVKSTHGLMAQPAVMDLAAGLAKARPFDVREYSAAAADMTSLTRELNQLMQSADKTLPSALDLSVTKTQKLMNHLFLMGLLFGFLMLLGIAGVMLVYRVIAKRI